MTRTQLVLVLTCEASAQLLEQSSSLVKASVGDVIEYIPHTESLSENWCLPQFLCYILRDLSL